jgi:Na+-translocating ferredoxin:NAD+ oxidoreductase RNF subunit RnfB
MSHLGSDQFVGLSRDRCGICHTCVRECPARAIQILDGQAQIIQERCIACGNCLRVCNRVVRRADPAAGRVLALLESGAQVAACIDPSFAAAFPELDHRQFAGMVRALGFAYVNESAFGAELVAEQYRSLIAEAGSGPYVSANCPAAVAYVERFHPGLVERLAPIVSPMVATARVLHGIHGPTLKTVFIGPCIAAKLEADNEAFQDDVAAALTFSELRRLLETQGIAPFCVDPSDFDPPHARLGGLAPISRGMLQVAGITEDLASGDVVAADGRRDFVAALDEFASGALGTRLLDIMVCKGCIMGPGMTTDAPMLQRRSRVSRYVREAAKRPDDKLDAASFDVDLTRTFQADDQRIAAPSELEITALLAQMGKHSPSDELNCGVCGYPTCREHATAIHKGLAETRMCLPYTIEELNRAVTDLAASHAESAKAGEASGHVEKLEGIGRFAAGLAHELNNPLGVILMHIHFLLEDAATSSKAAEDLAIAAEQVGRCKQMVGSLMHLSRFSEEARLSPLSRSVARFL